MNNVTVITSEKISLPTNPPKHFDLNNSDVKSLFQQNQAKNCNVQTFIPCDESLCPPERGIYIMF